MSEPASDFDPDFAEFRRLVWREVQWSRGDALAIRFDIARSTPEKWATGAERPHPLLRDQVIAWINEQHPGPKVYDPSKVVLTFNGIELKGYADGTFISHEPPSETVNCRCVINGSITMRLLTRRDRIIDMLIRHGTVRLGDFRQKYTDPDRRHRLRLERAARKRRRGWA